MTLEEAMRISEHRLPGEPGGDELTAWRASRPPPEPERKPRGLDTMQIDWAAVIRGTILGERAFLTEAIGGAIGQHGDSILDEAEQMIAAAVDQLRAELRAEFAGQLAQLRSEAETLGGELRAAIIARKRRASKAAKANGSHLLLPGPNGNGDARQQ